MTAIPLKFQIGARTIATIPRDMIRVALSLDAALAGDAVTLPTLGREDGYLVTSLPVMVAVDWPGMTIERQRYTRYFVDLAAGEAAWRAGLSGQARSGLKRKRRKLEGAATIAIRGYRTPEELAVFHPLARAVSVTTYQERLMDSGLPDSAAWRAEAADRAARDEVRAWLLFADDVPIAYLWCGADDATLRYDHVGHDPAWNALSPGSVLMEVALVDLFADRFRRFDFTEGEGQHKRSMASDGVACRDLLLLRPTIANRASVAALVTFDKAMAVAKRAAASGPLAGVARRVRRA